MGMEIYKDKKDHKFDSIHEEILTCVNNITFGEVVITVHNSKVVQIEKKEKKRF
jgi:hypothetical protein